MCMVMRVRVVELAIRRVFVVAVVLVLFGHVHSVLLDPAAAAAESHHGHETQFQACDATASPSRVSAGGASIAPARAAAPQPEPWPGFAADRWTAPQGPRRDHRPPLFLLHAALLI